MVAAKRKIVEMMRKSNGNAYSADSRPPMHRLYREYLRLAYEYGFALKVGYYGKPRNARSKFPIFCLKSPKKGKAVYIMAGVHGEEPAGPASIAESIELIGELSKSIPVIVIPLCNPWGYRNNWRTIDGTWDKNETRVVFASEHMLLNPENPKEPVVKRPYSKESSAFTRMLIECTKTHPPLLVIDHHEDDINIGSYVYNAGPLNWKDPIARKIERILNKGRPLQSKTRFDEPIIEGVVDFQGDGSSDELLAAKRIFYNGRIEKGPSAKTVITVETPTNLPLKKRVELHSNVIRNIGEFWQMAKEM
jgi:hypothetical protein